MSNNNQGNINLPLVIIGLVLVVALAGGWWFYNQSKTPPKKNTNGNTSIANVKTPTPATTNVLGADPPNMQGSPSSPVVVEEFADFQCPQCGLMYPKVKEVVSTYGSRIKFIFRNFPLAIPAHDKAYNAAVAAEAAGLQSKYWDMQNLLFTNQQSWSANPDYNKIWEGYADKIGLDVEQFKNDIAGLKAKGRVNADLERGRALNISSTPTIFVNGVAIPFEQMNVESMRQIIDAELAKAQSNKSQTNSSAPANTAHVEPKK